MTATIDSIKLAGIDAFRSSELTVARSLRDYMHFHLFSDAEAILEPINDELDAASRIALPEAYLEVGTYVDFSQILPQVPPFVHVLVPRWRRLEGHKKVRQYDAFVILVTGLEVPKKVAVAHGIIAEALSLMFSLPNKERLMAAEKITDVSVEEVLAQEASASELGYNLAGGEREPENTLLRETQYTLSVLKTEPRVIAPVIGDFDVDFDADFF